MQFLIGKMDLVYEKVWTTSINETNWQNSLVYEYQLRKTKMMYIGLGRKRNKFKIDALEGQLVDQVTPSRSYMCSRILEDGYCGNLQ